MVTTSDVEFELNLDALQLLDGDDAGLMIVHCTTSCAVSCSQSCTKTCGWTEIIP